MTFVLWWGVVVAVVFVAALTFEVAEKMGWWSVLLAYSVGAAFVGAATIFALGVTA